MSDFTSKSPMSLHQSETESKISDISTSDVKIKENGEWVIPSSTRADGSVRKEIKVRAGFIPQDEIKVYRPPARRTVAPDMELSSTNNRIKSESPKPTTEAYRPYSGQTRKSTQSNTNSQRQSNTNSNWRQNRNVPKSSVDDNKNTIDSLIDTVRTLKIEEISPAVLDIKQEVDTKLVNSPNDVEKKSVPTNNNPKTNQPSKRVSSYVIEE